jgi:glycerol-3-phosphate acyltransferase PlsY
MFAAAVYPIASYLIYYNFRSLGVALPTVLASCLIIAKHHANIGRLIHGTENKFRGKPKHPVDVERSL